MRSIAIESKWNHIHSPKTQSLLKLIGIWPNYSIRSSCRCVWTVIALRFDVYGPTEMGDAAQKTHWKPFDFFFFNRTTIVLSPFFLLSDIVKICKRCDRLVWSWYLPPRYAPQHFYQNRRDSMYARHWLLQKCSLCSDFVVVVAVADAAVGVYSALYYDFNTHFDYYILLFFFVNPVKCSTRAFRTYTRHCTSQYTTGELEFTVYFILIFSFSLCFSLPVSLDVFQLNRLQITLAINSILEWNSRSNGNPNKPQKLLNKPNQRLAFRLKIFLCKLIQHWMVRIMNSN